MGKHPRVGSLSVPTEPTNSLLNLAGEKKSLILGGGERAAIRADPQVPMSAHRK